MRIVLVGMRRSRADRLRTLLGQQASAMLAGETAPDNLTAPPASLKPFLNARAPAVVHFGEPPDYSTFVLQLQRAADWSARSREVLVMIGHISAAEAVAAALAAEDDPVAALQEWREDAEAVLGRIATDPAKTLAVNVAGGCAAPKELAFHFGLRFARPLFIRDPVEVSEGRPDALLVPAAQILVSDDEASTALDAELESAAVIGAKRLGALSASRLRAAAKLAREHRLRRERDEERSIEGVGQLGRALELRMKELKRNKLKIADLEAESRSLRAWQASTQRKAQADVEVLQRRLSRARKEIEELKSSLWWRLGRPFRAAYAALRKRLSKKNETKRHADLVRGHEFFDGAWYLQRYPDIASAGMDPALHFVSSGWRELRSPGPKFDVAAYLQDNEDVVEAGLNPFIHYITNGRDEQRAVRPVGAGGGFGGGW